MTRTKKPIPPPKAKPRGQRPPCLHCQRELQPQFTVPPPMPVRLFDGRRHTEREAWEERHRAAFTGHYGRYGDDRYCGQMCGYQWAVAHSRAKR